MTGPKSTSEAANLYWDTAARLVVVYADQRPLDVTAQEGAPREDRTTVGLTPQAKGEAKPHIAFTTERLKRIGGVLGKVVVDSVTVTAITLEGDRVEGAQQTLHHQYNEAGRPIQAETKSDEKTMDSDEALSELEAIAEHVLNMTADVPQSTLDVVHQALQELIAPPQDPPELPTLPQNPSA